ncbi:MAG TPA: hypothetical protein VK912_16555 [Longimicrobiales bacterium]|nr:hypothetical protein [Longimicrobiales bacterium]
MKNGRSLALALAVFVLAPLPLLAQGGGQGGRGGMGGGAMSARLLIDQGSVEYLVTKADHLGLTAEQKTGLEAIGARWSATTKESREQIRTRLPQPGQAAGGNREEMMQRLQEMRPFAEKVDEEDRKSLAGALALLNEEQQTKAKALIEERRQNARPRRGGGA